MLECDFCVRPNLSRHTPKADEDGLSLSSSEVLERYNERRYQHYLDDFNDALDLARHLNDRTNHYAETGVEEERAAIKESGFKANANTLAWWKRARERDADAAQATTVGIRPCVVCKTYHGDYEPTEAEIASWTRLSSSERFARLKKQILETFDGRHDVPPITAEDNAQQIPVELTLEEMQERDRQLAQLEELPL